MKIGMPGAKAAIGASSRVCRAEPSRAPAPPTGGRPLPTALREAMQASFGADFADVRIHTDRAAGEAAEALGARAFTLGRHVAFNHGEWRPDSGDGRRLLAHELAHIRQQRGASGAMPTVLPGAPERHPGHEAEAHRAATRAAEGRRVAVIASLAGPARVQAEDKPKPATLQDRLEFARAAIKQLEGQGQHFALQPKRDLSEVLKHLRTTVQGALSALAGQAAAAATADQVRLAYASAVRTVLASRTVADPKSVTVPPTMQELYERSRDEILSFGLPQAQADPNAEALSAELEAPLPAGASAAQRTRHAALKKARQRMKVVTGGVQAPIHDLFSTVGGKTTIPAPAKTTIRLEPSIPAGLHHGLRNLAAQLVDKPLVADSTLMLALDLTSFGGGYDAYRFTRLDLGTLGNEILVERQGPVGVEGLTTERRAALQKTFDDAGFRRGSGFGQDEFDQVLVGVAELTPAQLAPLRGLRFLRQSASGAHAKAAAEYDQATHEVHVFDRAYSNSMTRLGRAGHPLKVAAHAVAHELGHALDLGALRTTAAATEKAQGALLARFGTGGGSYSIPGKGSPERAEYDTLKGALDKAEAGERSARSRSGARWTSGDPVTVTDALAKGAANPAFREAVLADGGGAARMPTDYPNPESVWQEYFADAFSLFRSAPALLKRLRPNVHAFMEREFPP